MRKSILLYAEFFLARNPYGSYLLFNCVILSDLRIIWEHFHKCPWQTSMLNDSCAAGVVKYGKGEYALFQQKFWSCKGFQLIKESVYLLNLTNFFF